MLINCGRTGCKSTFETPPALLIRQAEQLLYQHNWVRRGGRGGSRYFCPAHNPDNATTRREREQDRARRGPRIASTCAPGCKDQPLFDLLGHDEVGHRTARRLRDYLVQREYAKLPAQSRTEPVPNTWSDAFVRSDTPLELLLEMPVKDIRRVPGVGPQSLRRLAEVLGDSPDWRVG
jgi:hypothetical protein